MYIQCHPISNLTAATDGCLHWIHVLLFYSVDLDVGALCRLEIVAHWTNIPTHNTTLILYLRAVYT